MSQVHDGTVRCGGSFVAMICYQLKCYYEEEEKAGVLAGGATWLQGVFAMNRTGWYEARCKDQHETVEALSRQEHCRILTNLGRQ